MYFKYVHMDDSRPQIRKVDNIKIVKDDDVYLLWPSSAETDSALLDSIVNRAAALFVGPGETLDRLYTIRGQKYYEIHPVWNRMASDPWYDALACFETVEKATEVMDKIAEAIARGDQLFDLTKYVEKEVHGT